MAINFLRLYPTIVTSVQQSSGIFFPGSDWSQWRGRGGGGVLNKFLYREAPPWGPTPADYLSNRLLFMSTFFWSKK